MKSTHLFITLISITVFDTAPVWASVFRSADPFDMGAAQASNASTEMYNPAGLTRLKDPQVVGSYIWFKQDIEFTGSVTEIPFPNATQHGESSTSFSSSLPAGFISIPVTDKFALGLSYSTPYGSPAGPTYPDDALVRFSYTELQLNTKNYSGALAYQVTDKWSIGAGLNYQPMEVMFNNVVLTAAGTTSTFNNSASGEAWWWHAGILFVPSKATRVGFTYWSGFTEKLSGESELVQLGRSSDNLKIDAHIPPTYIFSVFQGLSQKWGLNLTVGYTKWSDFSNIVLQDSAAGSITTEGVYKNTWRGTIGPGFKPNDKWAFDVSLRYEQFAIDNDLRLPSEPGDAHWSAGIGATYNFTDKISLKTRYIHPFFGTQDIDADTQAGKILYVGQEDRSANILGAQLIWAF
jgi:long-chain fatty acid transport protein